MPILSSFADSPQVLTEEDIPEGAVMPTAFPKHAKAFYGDPLSPEEEAKEAEMEEFKAWKAEQESAKKAEVAPPVDPAYEEWKKAQADKAESSDTVEGHGSAPYEKVGE